MQKIRRRESLGNHVAGFHEFYCKLICVCIIQTAPDHYALLHESITLDYLLDLRAHSQRTGGELGQSFDFRPSLAPAQRRSEQMKNHELASISFGSGHAAL